MVCLEDAHKMSLTAQKWETYRFTSKEFDRETGLYYYGARYYEPKLSNWMSADPAGFELINPMDSEGKPRKGYNIVEALNWYSYGGNNPVKYVDPTGKQIVNAYAMRQYGFDLAKGAVLAVGAAVADAAGQAGNFLANVFTGNASVSGNANLSLGQGLIKGELSVGSDGVTFSAASNLDPREVGEFLQDLAGANLQLTADGVELGINAVVLDGSISVSSNGDDTMTLSLGLSKDIGPLIEAGAEIGLTASTQDGPLGTARNRQSDELNKAVDKAIYLTDPNPMNH